MPLSIFSFSLCFMYLRLYTEDNTKLTNIIFNKYIQLVVFGSMVFPFLFIRSTKGMKFASRIVFISHVAFAVVNIFIYQFILQSVALNFILSFDLSRFRQENYFWWPKFGSKDPLNPDTKYNVNFKEAISFFPVVWMAFSF